MFDEIRKSINSTLYERTRSPLYSTFIISWCSWNWQLIYYFFVVDPKTPFFTRIDCIKNEITNNWTLIYGPILSTLIILTIFEIISNYAYWLHLYFKTWRINKKVKVEGKQLLTYEQSLKLRNNIRQTEEVYVKLIQEKENEIKILNDTLLLVPTKSKEIEEKPAQKINDKVNVIYDQFVRENILEDFKEHCSEILNGKPLLSTKLTQKFVTLGLFRRGVEWHGKNGHYFYSLTTFGEEMQDKILFAI